MLTVLASLLLAYACRGPVFGFLARMIAFSMGFVSGWKLVERR